MPILGEAEYIGHQFDGKRRKIEVEDDQIALIIRNAKRLERLASDILDVSKIESQSLKLNKEQFNLREVLSDTVQDVVNHLETNTGGDSAVRILYKPEDILVEADKGRMTQVISNLLNNAVKFTEKGVISVTVERKDDRVVVYVSDNGRGIDLEIFPRLFTKFSTKSESGTGLGLFISRSIIEAHNGKIWAKNNVTGKGATFAFSLPLKRDTRKLH